ncbi:hypothetical protein THRCLA_00974 [Thraustotheca clavata]|uniref:Uncharacterized protein n=1 Tax=Thraustotheca clavata TaxID=74557 RepID=A0A1W0A9L4_9STRA|nr:hypothetical protein THRCLA_00974 [Thraustotheca clavata]
MSCEDERTEYIRHVLATKKQHEIDQVNARHELRLRGARIVHEYTVDSVQKRYEEQCQAVRQQMLDDITQELKMLRENRDGVTLLRKGFNRAARTNKSNNVTSDDDQASSKNPLLNDLSSITNRNNPTSRKALGLQRYTPSLAYKTAPAPDFLLEDLTDIATYVMQSKRRRT